MQSDSRLWFYKTFGTEWGPFTFDELIELAKTNQLSSEDLVKFKADGKWRQAGSIGRLVAHLPYRPTTKKQPAQATAAEAISSKAHSIVEEPPVQMVKSPVSQVQPIPPICVNKVKPGLTVEHTTNPTKVDVPVIASNHFSEGKVRPSDSDLKRTLTEKIAEKNIRSFEQIELEVTSGVVSVRGSLSSEGERLLLIHLLKQVSGVQSVIDRLPVIASEPKPLPKVQPVAKAQTVMSKPKASSAGRPSFRMPIAFESVKRVHIAIGIAGLVIIGTLGMVLQAGTSSHGVRVFPAKGHMTLNGKPMPGATVILHPASSSEKLKGVQTRGIVESDGSFRLTTYRPDDGAPAGDFVVTVIWCERNENDREAPFGPNLAPAIYARPETSTLKLTIVKGTNDLPTIPLEAAASSTNEVRK